MAENETLVKINSELDETKDRRLSPSERVVLHEKIVLGLAEKEDFGIAKHISVREFEEYGENAGVIIITGITKSVVPGLRYTQHDMIYNPENFQEWVGLDQEKRQAKFLTEILPKIEQIVEAGNGWDGESSVMHPYAALMLQRHNESSSEVNHLFSIASGTPGLESIFEKRSKEEQQKVNQDIRERICKIPQNTLVIAESTMGSVGGLDTENANELDEAGIETQKLELIRNVGWEICEAKLKEIESDSWQQKKLEKTNKLLSALVNGIRPEGLNANEELSRTFNELIDIIDTEELVRSGRYADHKLAVAIGHSMNGNIVTRLMSHILKGVRMNQRYVDYRNKTDQENDQRCIDFKNRVVEAQKKAFDSENEIYPDEMTDHLERTAFKRVFSRKFGGLKPSDLVSFARNALTSETNDLKNVSETDFYRINELYPFLSIQAWMPVIFGDKSENLPAWAKRIKDMNPGEFHNRLGRDPLLNLTNDLAIFPPGRAAALKIGEVTGIVPGKVKRYVGDGVPDGLNEIYTHHIMDPNFVPNCNRILKKMRPPFLDETLEILDKDHLGRFSLMAGTSDETLLSTFALAMDDIFASIFAHPEYKVVKKFEGTGHHPKVKDMPVITGDLMGKLLWHQEQTRKRRSTENEKVILKLADAMNQN